MPRPLPQITKKDRLHEEETKIVTSKDLSRKGLMLYLFGDFLLALYLVACLFLDLIIVAPFYTYVPGYQESQSILSHIYAFPIVKAYFTILIIFVEFILIYYEIKYLLRFRRRMNYRDHELKKE